MDERERGSSVSGQSGAPIKVVGFEVTPSTADESTSVLVSPLPGEDPAVPQAEAVAQASQPASEAIAIPSSCAEEADPKAAGEGTPGLASDQVTPHAAPASVPPGAAGAAGEERADFATPDPGTGARDEPPSGLDHSNIKPVRLPVMILPAADSMTMSPVRLRPGRADALFGTHLEKAKGEGEEITREAAGSSSSATTEATPPSPAAPPQHKPTREGASPLGVAASRQAAPSPALARAADHSVPSPSGTGEDAPAPAPSLPPPSPPVTTEVAGEKEPRETREARGDKAKGKDARAAEGAKKPKLTRAERRELQERQRAAKAERLAKAGAGAGGAGGGGEGKVEAKPKQDKRPPKPQNQYDDEKKVQRQSRRSLVPRTSSIKSVELFSHLPQFDKGPIQASLENLVISSLHPEVVKLGKSYASNRVSGANARCLAMLSVFRLIIEEYSTPPGKALARDLTHHVNRVIQFLTDCRPLGVSMGNTIRFIKTRIGAVDPSVPEMEAKRLLLDVIDRFAQDKVVDAAATIAETASQKIHKNDVVLTYGFSHSVFLALKRAHDKGTKFRVVAVDCRPHNEGRKLMSRLTRLGISCTYVHVTALSYIMGQCTTVLMGAAAALANGTVISRVGTAQVGTIASHFGVPVIVCCETYKFHERVQLDAITWNELGDPEALVGVDSKPEGTQLKQWSDVPNLRLLNLMYDALTERYITMIVTEVGMIPASSVPVILREYNVRENLY